MIGIGASAKDKVTGVSGHITEKHESQNRCVRFKLEWLHDGSVHSEWFDVERLEEVHEEKAEAPTEEAHELDPADPPEQHVNIEATR